MYSVYAAALYPANTRRSPNVVTMLGQRRRRWPNIVPTLGERLLGMKNYKILYIFSHQKMQLHFAEYL